MPLINTNNVKVGILGAGLMGHGIAQAFMVAGFNVSIWDPDERSRASVISRIEGHLQVLGQKHAVELVVCDALDECVVDADLVIEAAPERLSIKQDLVRQVDRINQSCILATNTSVLRVTEIAAKSQLPHRVVGTHWWNPPYLMPLVEVVRGEQTSENIASQVKEWLVSASKIPVDVYLDVPGFVGNRMQFALVREAAYIVEQGICSAETVDLVARLTFGRRLAAIGPLKNSDFIGLDLVGSIMEYLLPSLSVEKGIPKLFAEKINEQALGAKTGEGVFEWEMSERSAVEQKLLKHLMSYEAEEER